MVNNLTKSPSFNANKSFFTKGSSSSGWRWGKEGLVYCPEGSVGLPRSNHSLCLLDRGRRGCIHHHPWLVQRWSQPWCHQILGSIFHWPDLKLRGNAPSRCPKGPSALWGKEKRVGNQGAGGPPPISSTEWQPPQLTLSCFPSPSHQVHVSLCFWLLTLRAFNPCLAD